MPERKLRIYRCVTPIVQPCTKILHSILPRYEWLLDGGAFNSYAADGSDGGSSKIKFGSKYSVFLGCSSGTVTYDWWEYAIPYEYFDWDD